MEKITVLTLLERTRTRLAKAEYWTQGAFARDKDGNAVEWRHVENEDAVAWDLRGAVHAEYLWAGMAIKDKFRYAVESLEAQDVLRFIALGHNNPIGSDWMRAYNDKHTHQEILALLDKAIAHVKEQQV